MILSGCTLVRRTARAGFEVVALCLYTPSKIPSKTPSWWVIVITKRDLIPSVVRIGSKRRRQLPAYQPAPGECLFVAKEAHLVICTSLKPMNQDTDNCPVFIGVTDIQPDACYGSGCSVNRCRMSPSRISDLFVFTSVHAKVVTPSLPVPRLILMSLVNLSVDGESLSPTQRFVRLQ